MNKFKEITEFCKPHCYKEGYWDGLTSDQILVRDKEGNNHVAIAYEGHLDGNQFLNFYDLRDFEIENVVEFMEIPESTTLYGRILM